VAEIGERFAAQKKPRAKKETSNNGWWKVFTNGY
jgi:hypothetical protein